MEAGKDSSALSEEQETQEAPGAPARTAENPGTTGNPQQVTAEEKEKSDRARRRRRRRRALRNALVRLALLAAVVYALFFHIVGLTVMPSGDMYPRVDAGDLLLFYRLETSPRAQDVIVLEKAVNTDLSAAEKENREEAEPEEETEDETGNETEEETMTADSTADPADTEYTADTAEPTRWQRIWRWLPDWGRDALLWLGFRDPDAPEKTVFVCRVVAAAGDTVSVTEDGRLIINGNSMIESNIFYTTTEYLGFTEYPVKLREGEVFVLADFRNGGADSRFFGPVRQEEILGTVITLLRRNNL